MNSNDRNHEIVNWLMTEARFVNNGRLVVEQIADKLSAAGVPIDRLRIAQRFSNPLLAAWGTIWHSDDTPTEEYTIPLQWLETDVWIGSPFQHVTEKRVSLRKRLDKLDRDSDHHVYFELADQGGTDFICLPIEYGDGTVQGMSAVSNSKDGFSDDDIELFDALRHPIAMLMEPLAARRSLASLLKAYLGHGPSKAVVSGAIHQRDVTRMGAVVMMTDMRDFTAKSANWDEERLLMVLGNYFEIVVQAVQEQGGDILKFIGDGVLAVFPADTGGSNPASSAAIAANAARKATMDWNRENPENAIDFGVGIHIGDVIYGNIGSQDRLDFTVIGEAVNIASRIEALTKSVGEPVLCSDAVARMIPEMVQSIGMHQLRGLPDASELFALKSP